METKMVCLGTYVLQKDMRMRLPKSLLSNLPLVCGETVLAVYVNSAKNEIVLRIENKEEDNEK